MDRDFDFTLTPTGDVYPCRFIALDTSADGTCHQAAANEFGIGISADQSEYAPGLVGVPRPYKLAEAGVNSVPLFGSGRKCLLTLGGTVSRGDKLISDANGQGVTAASTGTTIQWIGARALESGISGQKVLVLVEQYPYRPALS